MREADEVIIKALKKEPKTSKELKKECVDKRGLKYPTYRRHLNKLVQLGYVKETKYELIEKEKEVDPEIVRDCIQIIKSDEPDEIRVARARQIERLCYWKRTTHAPNLLLLLETSLDDENDDVRKHLASALANVLRYEQKRELIDVKIVKRVVDQNIENMTRLASEDRNHQVRVAVLKFLGYTGDVRALAPIFEIIRKSNKEEYESMKEWVQWVLFTPEYLLAKKKLRRDVSHRLDEMLMDPVEHVRNRAKELHKYMLSPDGMQ